MRDAHSSACPDRERGSDRGEEEVLFSAVLYLEEAQLGALRDGTSLSSSAYMRPQKGEELSHIDLQLTLSYAK